MNTHTKFKPLSQPAPVPVAVAPDSRILHCQTCGTWTKHSRARVKGQSLYVCACGTEIIHIVVMKIVEKG